MPIQGASYERQKQVFEESMACITLHGQEYYVRVGSGTVAATVVMDKQRLLDHFEPYTFLDEQDNNTRKQFVPRWLQDTTRKHVQSKIVCDPNETDHNTLNLWRPFRAESFEHIEDIEKFIEPILEFIHNAHGDAGAVELLEFLAQTVQNPSEHLPDGLAIVGDDWYTCSCLVHFFCTYVVGPYLSTRLLTPRACDRKGYKFLWVDCHDIPEDYFDIPAEKYTQGNDERGPEWYMENKANMIATTRCVPNSDNFRVVHCKSNCCPPASVEALFCSGVAARAFYEYLLQYGKSNTRGC